MHVAWQAPLSCCKECCRCNGWLPPRLQERNIPQELDLARTAMETVVRQLTTVTKTNQVRAHAADATTLSDRNGDEGQRHLLQTRRPGKLCRYILPWFYHGVGGFTTPPR